MKLKPYLSQYVNPKETLISLIVILILYYILTNLLGGYSIDQIQIIVGNNIYSPFILIAIKALTIIIAPLAGTPIYVAAGALFGFTKGFAYIFLGDLIGYTVLYFLGNKLGNKFFNYVLTERSTNSMNKLSKYFNKFWYLTGIHFIFITIPEILAILVANQKVSYWKYILANRLALIPFSVVVIYYGDVYADQIDKLLLALGIVGIVSALLPYTLRRKLSISK